jgi:hypothetical protein
MAKFYSRMLPQLASRLTQHGIRCRKHRLIVIIRQPSEQMSNPTERLAQKQIGRELVRGGRATISLRELKLGIVATEDTR